MNLDITAERIVPNKKFRKRSTKSLKDFSNNVRSVSEGQTRASRYRNVSRDSSTGSSVMSLDVRCACQYFQCDSLLPDRVNPVGTRPQSRTSNSILIAKSLGDHEYEPVNPPETSDPTVHVIDTQSPLTIKPISSASSTTSLEKRMLTVTQPKQEEIPVHNIQIKEKHLSEPSSTSSVQCDQKSKPKTPGKLEMVLKEQAGKFKSKLHGIKKPNIHLPEVHRPKFEKPNFKFEKPKFNLSNLPKMPDTSKIHLPSFSLPRKTSGSKLSVKQRQYSTESNAGGSKKHYFNFKTYPRMFKKKQASSNDFSSSFSSKSDPEPAVVVPEFATVPRTKRNKNENDRWGGRDSIRIPLHGESFESKSGPEEEQLESDSIPFNQDKVSRTGYENDIDIDDAYEKENQQIHSASPFSHSYNSRWNHGSFHPEPNTEEENLRNQQTTDLDSPEEGTTRNNRFEINTSKDINSSASSLEMHRHGVLEEIDSDEFFLRQKGISQDNIEVGAYLSSEIREAFKSPGNALSDLSYAAMASNQSLPETPTKKKQLKKPKRKKTPHVSQEEMLYQDSEPELEYLPPLRPRRKSKRNKKRETDVIPYQETIAMDVNEEIEVSKEAQQLLNEYENEDIESKDLHGHYEDEEEPPVPPRKHRSLKSLTVSEHDSILGVNMDEEFPPIKPPRTLSQSSSKSHEYSLDEQPPVRPMRTRSHSRTRSRAESLNSVPLCVEEPCTAECRDYMGYATIDKTKREPPLPPTTQRRRKKSLNSEPKFFTVPRQLHEETPVRPLRNYSTLGPSRPPRKKNLTDEEKQQSVVDITQYIEIEEECNRDLHSGQVIQKMKDRPLPPPPRPPRKIRVHDQTGEVNDVIDTEEREEETKLSTQMEPMLKDEITHEEQSPDNLSQSTTSIEKRLITPTSYTYEEETITHGSLVVQPLDGAKILPNSELTTRERRISITKDYDEEDSEIPEEFYKLKSIPTTEQPKVDINPEIEVLKAQKLQVTDLDVDRLSVNELLASKIVVSEIESENIHVNDISSKAGSLKVGEMEIPRSIVQQLFERLQLQVDAPEVASAASAVPVESESDKIEQKKTPIEQVAVVDKLPSQPEITLTPEVEPFIDAEIYETPIPEPPQRTQSTQQIAEPQRPPRLKSDKPEELEMDDEPPPRPPHPEVEYIPSQPPTSFYALRAQQFVANIDDGDIPMPPRRRRHHKVPPTPGSSSDDDSPLHPLPTRRRVRSPEPSIPQLTGQLIQACGTAANCTIKRLITHITNNVLQNADGRQDIHVMMVILLILIAGLILLGFGDGKTVHYHHWEYFNPPREM